MYTKKLSMILHKIFNKLYKNKENNTCNKRVTIITRKRKAFFFLI